MAWIVNEDNLADMYLNLDGEGGAYDFNEGMLEAGVVDIRKYMVVKGFSELWMNNRYGDD